MIEVSGNADSEAIVERDAMADFFSTRFGKNVWPSRHARGSMEKRQIDLPTLQSIVDSGKVTYKTASDVWIYTEIVGRSDNLI